MEPFLRKENFGMVSCQFPIPSPFQVLVLDRFWLWPYITCSTEKKTCMKPVISESESAVDLDCDFFFFSQPFKKIHPTSNHLWLHLPLWGSPWNCCWLVNRASQRCSGFLQRRRNRRNRAWCSPPECSLWWSGSHPRRWWPVGGGDDRKEGERSTDDPLNPWLSERHW